MPPGVDPWTAARIWDAFERGAWVPPGATRIETGDYLLALTPGSTPLTYVYAFRAEPPERFDEVLAGLKARVKEQGGTGARIQVTPRTRPRDLAHRLVTRGFRPLDESDLMVRELEAVPARSAEPGGGSAPGIEVREVRTDDDYRTYLRLSDEVFGNPPPPSAVEDEFFALFRRQREAGQPSGRFLAWEAGVPAGIGGGHANGPVLFLWGGGVLSSHRHRGIYRALVAARLDAARSAGAEIALTTARRRSSGPILERLGFRRVGAVRLYEGSF